MGDKNIGSKKTSEKLFPRWMLFGMAGLIALCNLELNVLQVFRAQDNEPIYELGGLFILLLIIPFVAFVMVPLIDKCNDMANRRPILIRISRNSVCAKRLDCEISRECAGDFSEGEIVSDADKLADAVSNAIRACTKYSKAFTLAPYIVFTASEPLSEVQRKAAEEAIKYAGALDVKYMAACLSDSEALEFVRQNPTSFNFA